jgi:hypothetical protein
MNQPTLTTQTVEIVTGCEVAMVFDKIRADIIWRAMFRDLDALAVEFDKPFYDRRSNGEILSDFAGLSNMLREIRAIVGISEKTLDEMLNDYQFC